MTRCLFCEKLYETVNEARKRNACLSFEFNLAIRLILHHTEIKEPDLIGSFQMTSV